MKIQWIGVCAAALMAAVVVAGATPEPDRLLTDAEIKSLDRENAMWRLVQPAEGVQANVAKLRQAGYSEAEVAALQPQLAALWTVPYQRNYGWLRPETIERIQTIDRHFVARMRTTQLYRQTGVQITGNAGESTAYINRQWREAIMDVLDHRESAEFRLMNSASARDEMRLTKGMTLTADEQRTLFEWRQEYDGRHGASLAVTSGLSSWQREIQLDQCRRIRHLLGDERFAVYFSRVNPVFERMRTTLTQLGETNPTPMLELWWLRQKEFVAIDRIAGLKAQERSEKIAQLRLRAANVVGEARLAAYVEAEDGRWLTTAARPRRVGQNPPRENRAGTFAIPDRNPSTP